MVQPEHSSDTFTLSHPVVLASHNAGKLREIRALLEPLGLRVIDAATAGVDEPEETETSFIGNARLKSLHSARHTGSCALSDDSGLVVPAIGGDPGIYSARWAGEQKDFAHAAAKVEQKISESGLTPHGTLAYFVCALSLAWPNGRTIDVEGTVHGSLCFPARGTRGFGYDPIFIAKGHDVTFGEMEPELKHSISHRADAFNKLLAALRAERLIP